jgi:hypothetical protein
VAGNFHTPMLEYLKKFNNLPADLRQKVSDGQAMGKIEALEKKYNITLAALIMKVMVKEVSLNDLAGYLFKENLSKEQAEGLARELKENIFSSLGNYFSVSALKSTIPTANVAPIDEPKVKGASFFFSSDDEEEIRNLTKKIIIAENSNMAPGVIDEKLKEIVSRSEINFGSADLADRFSQILKTYLRGIRDKLDTKVALMKPFLNGGLSFDEDSAEKAIALADKVLNSEPSQPFEPLPKIKLPELEKTDSLKKREISRDAAYDFSKLAERSEKIKNDLKKLDTSHEIAPLAPAVAIAVEQKTVPKAKEKVPASPKNISPKITPIQPENKSDLGTMPLIKRRFEAENLNQSQKVKLEDVKYVPRVMGPLDEIKYMDLINFRRLDKDPLRSAEKIKNKINLLEEDYGKKLEGIKYWRQSPIYKLYLEIGRLSIGGNKAVDVIIEERKMNNQEYLTADEFKAIMDLNKSLRF